MYFFRLISIHFRPKTALSSSKYLKKALPAKPDQALPDIIHFGTKLNQK